MCHVAPDLGALRVKAVNAECVLSAKRPETKWGPDESKSAGAQANRRLSRSGGQKVPLIAGEMSVYAIFPKYAAEFKGRDDIASRRVEVDMRTFRDIIRHDQRSECPSPKMLNPLSLL